MVEAEAQNKRKEKKACKTDLYGKIKRGAKDGGLIVNWSAHTKHKLPFICNYTRRDKAKECKVRINDG